VAIKRYLVGGAVRDRLLGLPVRERDWLVAGATVDELLAAGYRRVGRDFPVFIHPETGEEHTLACAVRGKLATASPAVAVETDLRERDLTVNALAETEDGALIDCVGGLDDLRSRVLRHVSSQGFAADPLRVLRAARFLAQLAPYGFGIAGPTLDLMADLANRGVLDDLTPERVWKELERALAAPEPWRFFAALRECGALARVLPEIDRLWGVPQPAKWHPEIDTGVHTLMVLREAARLSPQAHVRFAALVHDLGKGTTPTDMLPAHRGHEARGVEVIDALCDRLRAPNRFRDLGRLAARLHGLVHRADELRPATVLDVIEQADAIRRPERFEELLLACEADYRGRGGFGDRPYPQADWFRQALAATAAVDVAALARGTRADLLPATVHQARVAAIRQLERPPTPEA
jgi:tRNA nucleotidyltransferase (CCA-adding enzyme)